MKYLLDKEIPVIAETDVLIVGGGAGGIGAGVMAARQGVSVLLTERYGCLGGMATFGEVTPFMPNHVKGEPLDQPVYTDWCRRLWHYHSLPEQQACPFSTKALVRSIEKDEVILATEDLLLESGVRILYHHTLVDVIREGESIQAAVFHSKSGFCAIRAKVYIDSTGDGDLAVLAGCPSEFGDQDGICQPMTTCFKLAGIDIARMPSNQEINHLYDEAKAAGELDCPRHNVLWFKTPEKDVLHFNTTRIIRKSAIDGVELSEAEIEGRHQVREIIRFLRTRVPGFEQAKLRSIAHHVGVRESRRILGIIYQTAQDFTNTAKFPDGIARVNYPIDIHNPTGSGTTMQRIPDSEWYEIRYGTLVPRNSSNLLMGCRAISVDHALHSSSRIMPAVCSIGQAAGMAAAICVQKNCAPGSLSGEEVRRQLIRAGARL